MADNNNVFPTQGDIIDKCKLEWCEKKVAAMSTAEAEATDAKTQSEITQFNVYCYNNTWAMLNLYGGLDRCYVIPVTQKKKMIKSRLELLIEKNTQLTSKYKELVKLIRDMRGKYVDVLDEACKIGRCFEEEDRCNADTYDMLSEAGLIGEIATIETNARNYNDKLCKVVDASIDIAGIQTFTNIKSLVPYCDRIMEYLDTLRQDVDRNISDVNAQFDKDKENIGEAMGASVTTGFELCDAKINTASICEVFDYVDDDTACAYAADNGEADIETVCRKLQKTELLEDSNDDCDEYRNKVATGRKGSTKKTARKTTTRKASAKKPSAKSTKSTRKTDNKTKPKSDEGDDTK